MPELVLSEHLRLNAVYWAVTALALMDELVVYDRQEVVDYVMSCQDVESGGFGGHVGHDPHLLYTLSAIQVLATYDALDRIGDQEKVVQCECSPLYTFIHGHCDLISKPDIVGLQNTQDGSFSGDEFGESDARLTFAALLSLSLLKSLDKCNIENATEYIRRCQNVDGGYGSTPGGESHSGLVFCCVGALYLLKREDLIDQDQLGWWLAERQLPCGGLNGRPEKLEDVCYSWWVLSSLTMMGKSDWIETSKLAEFILKAQHPEMGGIADRPGHQPDIFHTLFGIAGKFHLLWINHAFSLILLMIRIVHDRQIQSQTCRSKVLHACRSHSAFGIGLTMHIHNKIVNKETIPF